MQYKQNMRLTNEKKKTSKNTPDIIDFNLIDHQIFIILVREKQNKQNVRWSKEKSQ